MERNTCRDEKENYEGQCGEQRCRAVRGGPENARENAKILYEESVHLRP